MDKYDFIILGAGSAGCVLANRLSANPEFKVYTLNSGFALNLLARTQPAEPAPRIMKSYLSIFFPQKYLI